MLNKKELEKRGYSFIKIDGAEFLDMSNPVEKKVIRCPIVEAEQAMRNHFLETSQKRGKTIDILLPLMDPDKITDLIAELYDLRADTAQRKVEDQMAKQEVAGVIEKVGSILNNPNVVKKLNSFVDKKCIPKNQKPKITQKKKVQKKK